MDDLWGTKWQDKERFLFLLIVEQKLQSWPWGKHQSQTTWLNDSLIVKHSKISSQSMNGIYSVTLKAIIESSNIKRKTSLEQPVQSFRSYDTPPAKTSRWIFLILRNVFSATGISWHSGWAACGLLGKGLGDWYRTLNLNLIVFLCLAKLFPICGQPRGGNVNIQNILMTILCCQPQYKTTLSWLALLQGASVLLKWKVHSKKKKENVSLLSHKQLC